MPPGGYKVEINTVRSLKSNGVDPVGVNHRRACRHVLVAELLPRQLNTMLLQSLQTTVTVLGDNQREFKTTKFGV